MTYIFIIAIFFLVFPSNTHAYFDPATLSFIVQAILGFVFGISLATKVYWGKIMKFVRKIRDKNTTKGDTQEVIEDVSFSHTDPEVDSPVLDIDEEA